jgi:hypothetical protein
MAKKGFRVHLAYAGTGRYLLTTQRLLWYRWFPSGLKSFGYVRAVNPGMRLYPDNLIEILLASVSAISRRLWPEENQQVPRINFKVGDREMAMMCVEEKTLESLGGRTEEFFTLMRTHTTALDLTS